MPSPGKKYKFQPQSSDFHEIITVSICHVQWQLTIQARSIACRTLLIIPPNQQRIHIPCKHFIFYCKCMKWIFVKENPKTVSIVNEKTKQKQTNKPSKWSLYSIVYDRIESIWLLIISTDTASLSYRHCTATSVLLDNITINIFIRNNHSLQYIPAPFYSRPTSRSRHDRKTQN